jgi:hypothetical protein
VSSKVKARKRNRNRRSAVVRTKGWRESKTPPGRPIDFIIEMLGGKKEGA